MESVEKSLRQRQIPNFDKGSQVLGVFAKQPLAGRVKTRLCPPLNYQQAADLYRISLQETVARMTSVERRVILFYEGDRSWFTEGFPGLELRPQAEGDLGRRIIYALLELFVVGGQRVALIGTDSPDLPQDMVDDAFTALQQHDAVTIPAADGGYVLVGCRKPCSGLFDGIDWSTSAVLQQTRVRARQMGLDYFEVGAWEDLDDAPSLLRLLERSPDSLASQYVRKNLLASLGG